MVEVSYQRPGAHWVAFLPVLIVLSPREAVTILQHLQTDPDPGAPPMIARITRALDGIVIEEDGDELQGGGRPAEIRR